MTIERVKPGDERVEGCFIEDNCIPLVINALSEEVDEKIYCRVVLHKVIPFASGLGGGSSDAAAVLKALNKLYMFGLSTKELERVGRSVGSDVPFFFHGGRAKIKGASVQEITELKSPNLFYVLARPHKRLITKEMYMEHDATGKSFLELATKKCPEIPALLHQFGKDAVEKGLTGKGPTVFAGFHDYASCERASRKVAWLNGDIFIAKALNRNREEFIEL
ncbi:MAG: hypothetical protein M1500_01160 [Candidatus Marsarchaeota archaeon]|nr:hypothetical protein [Candidatus Marsarchaeota archaeon]